MKETILMSREDLQEMMCGIVKNAVREVLDEFRQHRLRFPSHTCGRKLDDTILRFELCPTAAETRGWTREDWMQLIHEFIQTLDRLEKVKLKQGMDGHRGRTSSGLTSHVLRHPPTDAPMGLG